MITEKDMSKLVDLSMEYARRMNLDFVEYICAMLNTDNIGKADPKAIVDIMIRYHEEWLRKCS